MVWQRAGTVSVQNGSTTVTGAGVDFAASSRVGDSFVGPDGATYEVANVASATVISILPAYKGATASGAAYAIMPVQGYDKMLSDAFNSLNNQFGPKLAALGTTGNYDVLPVAKGGTGLTSLGTAISSNVTITANSSTAGSLVKVFDYGLGLTHVTPIANIDSGPGPGADHFFSTPQTSGTKPFDYGFVRVMAQANNNFYQVAYEIVSGSRVATRFYVNGAWQAWRIQYDTSNTTRASDGTLKAV